MRELILIFTYIIAAFIPVIVLRKAGELYSHRSFWSAWFISLTGAFAGGMFGTMLLVKTGLEFGFFAGVFPAFVGSWLITYLFVKLRKMPGNW